VTIISRGVEISIAGGGEEMVRAYLLVVSFFFFLLSCVICFRYKKRYAARAMKRKKPISPITTARFTSS